MFLKMLKLRNYACHAETVMDEIGPISVLVGPNGSGKSALFEGIRTFSRVLTGPVAQAFGPPPFSFADKLYRGSRRQEMEFDAKLSDGVFPTDVQYTIKLGYTGTENVGSAPSILAERVSLGSELVFDRAAGRLSVAGMKIEDIRPDVSLLATIRSSPSERAFRGPKILANLARRMGSVVNYRLEPRQLSLPSQEPVGDALVRMGYEGDNLAACLFWLTENEPRRLEKIVRDIQKVIPDLKGITLNSVGVDRVGFTVEFSDARHGVLAPNVSSGTLLLLGLVTLLNAPTQPDIACIEEPETGLTPDAVRLFFQLLCSVATPTHGHFPSQFFFSSHSPFVLVDAWSTLVEDRSFIKRLHIANGQTVVESIQSIIDRGDSGAVLQRDKHGRTTLGLKTAEELMCGRFLC